jgi:hypothetical protein
MKSFLIVLLTLGILLPVLNAQEQKGQLWLAGVEVVKPEMVTQYLDYNKAMTALCKAEKFPYSFSIWTTGDFTYYIFYPIKSLEDIPAIDKAWQDIVDKWGTEKYAGFQECLEYTEQKVMITRPDLTVEPQQPAATMEENHYCWWQEFYLKNGHEKAVEAIIGEGIKLIGNKNIQMFMGYGKSGFELPVLIMYSYGKSKNDFWIKDKSNWEQMDEQTIAAFRKIDDEFTTHLRKYIYRDMWWQKDISYEKAE